MSYQLSEDVHRVMKRLGIDPPAWHSFRSKDRRRKTIPPRQLSPEHRAKIKATKQRNKLGEQEYQKIQDQIRVLERAAMVLKVLLFGHLALLAGVIYWAVT